MLCESVIRHLDQYRTSELPAGTLQEIRNHLARCAACSAELSVLESIAECARHALVRAPSSLVPTVLRTSTDCYGTIETDLGKIWIGFNVGGITMINLRPHTATEFEQEYRRRVRRDARPENVPLPFANTVFAAVAGRPVVSPPVDLSSATPFEREVLHLLLRIPAGEVRTYTWLAREAHRPAAVRAVGNVMARNPVPLLLPCHRVVPAQGGVGNYAFGPTLKRELLRREGVRLEEL